MYNFSQQLWGKVENNFEGKNKRRFILSYEKTKLAMRLVYSVLKGNKITLIRCSSPK